MGILGIIADVLVILCAVALLLGIPFIWVGTAKELKKDYVEELREEVETKRTAWKHLLIENEELKIQLEEKETLCAELKEESDSYWRQLSGFLQRHPEEVETIDEDEINNPDDYKYVAR